MSADVREDALLSQRLDRGKGSTTTKSKGRNHSVRAERQIPRDVSSNDIVGQFSFAPATQTTVVTTTTTTTTSFPPLVMKAPRHLHELDSTLYPLAASPTPQSIKELCFEVGDRPTIFREAEDTFEAVNELDKEQSNLRKSNGVLRNIVQSKSDFQTPRFESSKSKKSYRHALSQSPNLERNNLKRPVSPVSISEAARLAAQRGTKKRRQDTRERNAQTQVEPVAWNPPQSGLASCQITTPDASILENFESFDELNAGMQRQQTLEKGDEHGHLSYSSEALERNRSNPQTLSPRPEIPGAVSFESVDHVMGGDPSIPGAITPVRTDGDVVEKAVTSELPLARARRPRPHILDTTAAQDASLPSPSLSPVTAALNLQNRGSYFEQSSRDDTDSKGSFFESDYANSQGRDEARCGERSSQVQKQRPRDPIPGGLIEPAPENEQLSTLSMMDIPKMLDSFEAMPAEMKSYVAYQMLRRCPKSVLHFVADVVNPALKCDFISLLPLELSLNIVSHFDVKTLCRAAQVSKKWRQIIDSDERAWKRLFDANGYSIPEGELQRAIREGWGWQHASRPDDWEQSLAISGNVPSDTERSLSSSHVLHPSFGNATSAAEDSIPHNRRSKRRANPKSKAKSRKQQKKNEIQLSATASLDADAWNEAMTAAEGPYAAATAAAMAVPYPHVGLASLKNLHLFKSIYLRHHMIRKSWMQDKTKPRHIAFRAHQRHVVTCLQFDTDKILTGSDDTKINVYDTQTGALRARLEGHEGGVWALQYEGNILVSGSTDRSVRVWDIEKGSCTQVFQGHTSTVRCLQILMPAEVDRTLNGKPIMMPKQPLIITGSRDSNLRVWKLPKQGDEPFFQAGPPQDDTDCPYFVRVLTGHHHSVRAIAAHADTLVSGSYDCSVRVWKISTGETLHRLTGHSQKVYSVVLDHKRNRCISGSMDNLVKVWSLDTGSVLFNLEGHSSLVGLLDLQQDRLVSAAADSTLRIWDPETGHCKSTLSAHTGAITCFQHDGQKVISGSDRTLKMWNVTNGKFVKDLLTELSGVWQVNFNERRCVAAVQRNGLTYIEVLDFGAARDGVPESKRGRRIVVDIDGKEVSDPLDATIEMEGTVEE
ncbi:MAG: hypothetical protein LQ342_003271 [Letrouitia transgressa]|nr:MAG: hypothetical protein LQ342_003271 [Letrouitia transgressa]